MYSRYELYYCLRGAVRSLSLEWGLDMPPAPRCGRGHDSSSRVRPFKICEKAWREFIALLFISYLPPALNPFFTLTPHMSS